MVFARNNSGFIVPAQKGDLAIALLLLGASHLPRAYPLFSSPSEIRLVGSLFTPVAAMTDQRTANQINAIRHALMGLIQVFGGLIADKHPDKAEYLRRLWESLRTLKIESD